MGGGGGVISSYSLSFGAPLFRTLRLIRNINVHRLTWRWGVYLKRTGHVWPERRYGVVPVHKTAVVLRGLLRWIIHGDAVVVIADSGLLFDHFANLRF